MGSDLYMRLKNVVNSVTPSSAILKVTVDENGNFKEMHYFTMNKSFLMDCMAMFFQNKDSQNLSMEEKVVELEKRMEGAPYTINVPKEPKFEDFCYRAAWKKQPIHTYVDTTMMYGYWTEDYMIPIDVPDDEKEPNEAFCQFMYTLNKEMDTNKYSGVSPDIAAFVIKTCLELRNENDFYSSMDIVTRYIREYTDSAAASVMSYQPDFEKYEVVSDATDNPQISLKKIFSSIPFSIVASWEKLFRTSNIVIIKDESDMEHYAKIAPEWIQTLRDNDVTNLCLVPFIHQGAIIGFLYIAKFDLASLTRVK